jgi:hypothetical protein
MPIKPAMADSRDTKAIPMSRFAGAERLLRRMPDDRPELRVMSALNGERRPIF